MWIFRAIPAAFSSESRMDTEPSKPKLTDSLFALIRHLLDLECPNNSRYPEEIIEYEDDVLSSSLLDFFNEHCANGECNCKKNMFNSAINDIFEPECEEAIVPHFAVIDKVIHLVLSYIKQIEQGMYRRATDEYIEVQSPAKRKSTDDRYKMSPLARRDFDILQRVEAQMEPVLDKFVQLVAHHGLFMPVSEPGECFFAIGGVALDEAFKITKNKKLILKLIKKSILNPTGEPAYIRFAVFTTLSIINENQLTDNCIDALLSGREIEYLLEPLIEETFTGILSKDVANFALKSLVRKMYDDRKRNST